MKPSTLALMSGVLLMAAFLGLNWAVLGTPLAISFGVAHATLPVGFVLLGLALLLLVLFFSALLRVQFGLLQAQRRHSTELRAHRELAERAETSRYTELRQYLEQQLGGIRTEIQQTEQRLHQEIVSSSNALAASVGEVDERLERQFPVSAADRP